MGAEQGASCWILSAELSERLGNDCAGVRASERRRRRRWRQEEDQLVTAGGGPVDEDDEDDEDARRLGRREIR